MGGGGTIGETGGAEGGNPTLYDRLCMMETSVLLQSQELKRTKRLFLRDKERLEIQLAQSLEEVDGRDKIIKERDYDNEGRVKALKNVEEELKGEVERLRWKIGEQQVMIEGVKKKMVERGEVESAGRPSVESVGRPSVEILVSPLSSGVVRPRGESFGRRGTTMGLLSSNNGRKDAKGVGVTRDELERGASEAYKEAIDRLREFSTEHGIGLEGEEAPSPVAGGDEEGSAGRGLRVRARSGSVPDVAPVQKVWTEHFDANHGVPYYHNRITNETTWEPPPGYEEEGK